MSDEVRDAAPQHQYPNPSLPTFFADGVLNLNNSTQIAKFYFTRLDPPLNAVGPTLAQPICQAVMPLTAFVQTAAFFNASVASLIAQKLVTADEWKAAQNAQNEVATNG